MGKAGEKQKRRPKIKDSKQSERFKKAARELGADKEADVFADIVKELGPKYRLYRHRIYNARCLIKKIDIPFPSELVESEWRPMATTSDSFDGADPDLRTRGYHLYEVDLTAEYGADEPGPGQH